MQQKTLALDFDRGGANNLDLIFMNQRKQNEHFYVVEITGELKGIGERIWTAISLEKGLTTLSTFRAISSQRSRRYTCSRFKRGFHLLVGRREYLQTNEKKELAQ